jgi:hypothetical protein
VISEDDIAAILEKARSFGPANMEKAEIPMIRADANGHPYAIKFLDCDGPAGCKDFLLQTYLFGPRVDLDLANSWNRDRRWTKVYYDADDDIALEMDVDLTGGISESSLDRTFAIWNEAVDAFKIFFPAL